MANMNAVDQHAIYNTEWVRDDRMPVNKFVSKDAVVHPPVYIDDYKTDRINNYITLINCNANKGGLFLQELAKAMPDRKFMGVMGSYGVQQIDWKIKNIHYCYNN